MMRTRVLINVPCWFRGRFGTKSWCPAAAWKEAACSWVLLARCCSRLPPSPWSGRLGPGLAAPPAEHRSPLGAFSSCGPAVKSWGNLGFSVTSWIHSDHSCRWLFVPPFGLGWPLPEAGTQVPATYLFLP